MAEYIDRKEAHDRLLDMCLITGYNGLTKHDIEAVFRNLHNADVIEVGKVLSRTDSVLETLNAINSEGRIPYDVYSELHNEISEICYTGGEGE